MASLELRRLAESTYVIPSPTNIGLWVYDGRATLIDSGNDEDAGRQILKLLESRGWALELIINTHSNADHVGGNAFLSRRTGCRIAATAIEAGFVERPELEPSLLFGGFPLKGLRNKFLMAKPSIVTDRIADEGPIAVPMAGGPLLAVPLPGHFLGMIGVRTPDDVVFLADCLFSERIMEKYPVFFLYDVKAHMETLGRLRDLRAAWYVPSHAEPTEDIGGLVSANLARAAATVELVASCCGEGASFDVIVSRVCAALRIALDLSQYALVGSTVRSMLSYLADSGRVEPSFGEGGALWRLVG